MDPFFFVLRRGAFSVSLLGGGPFWPFIKGGPFFGPFVLGPSLSLHSGPPKKRLRGALSWGALFCPFVWDALFGPSFFFGGGRRGGGFGPFWACFVRLLFSFFLPLPTVPFLPESPPPSSDLKTPPFPRGNAILRGWGAARVLEGVTPQKKEGISLKNGAQKLVGCSELLPKKHYITKIHGNFRFLPRIGPITLHNFIPTELIPDYVM